MAREVRMEAGDRCAIPTCRRESVLELAHIEAWSKVGQHTFDNLILLCAICHARYDRGEIDRLSMLGYKANLSIINNRYGDMERRILEAFAQQPAADGIDLPGGLRMLMHYLLRDGYFQVMPSPNNFMTVGGGDGQQFVGLERYVITPKGREFVTRWAKATPLDQENDS